MQSALQQMVVQVDTRLETIVKMQWSVSKSSLSSTPLHKTRHKCHTLVMQKLQLENSDVVLLHAHAVSPAAPCKAEYKLGRRLNLSSNTSRLLAESNGVKGSQVTQACNTAGQWCLQRLLQSNLMTVQALCDELL